jgi:cell division protein FtsZ
MELDLAWDMILEDEIARVEEEVLSVPPTSPAPTSFEPTLAQRAEPTMTLRREAPTQGSLHMDMPATPRERLGDLRVERTLAAASQPPAAPVVEEPAPEPAPKPGLFSRWTSAARPAAAQPAAPARTEPKAPAMPAAQARPAAQPVQRPAADMSAARVAPTDRLTTSKAEEDLLDIPAFLRRQAN